ncbi:MAG: hypothetical protein K2Y22_00850 [Candidatus Obscuribacterales bacterium]|nr:hypothetical protein [Candidatus Obscuribacterales bacterium]
MKQSIPLLALLSLILQLPSYGQYTVIDANPGGPTAETVAPVKPILYPQLTGSVETDEVSLSKGSRFRVSLMTDVSSQTATLGDTVEASLVDDLTINGITVAKKGDVVTGQVTDVARAERTIKSYIPRHHFLDPEGRLAITFLSLQNKSGATSISATLAPQTEIESAGSTLRLIVNKGGDAEVKSITTRYLVADAVLAGGLVAAGPIGLAVAPAVTGIAGAISPSYALGHQVEAGESHSRVKDFLLGASRGVPGGVIVSGIATHGEDIKLTKGDELVVELSQDAFFNR